MIWCIFGVVAAASFLPRLPPEAIEHALGVAGELIPTHNPVLTPRPVGSDVKEGIPWAVLTGMLVVDLAKKGHTSARNILDVQERYEYPADLRLGEGMHIFKVYFKLYATCRYIHAPIDATLDLLEQDRITVEDIKSIAVHTIASAVRLENKTKTENFTYVVWSVPYSVALVLVHGRESMLPLTSESVGLSEVSALARKIKVFKDEKLEARFPAETLARVSITTKDGQNHHSSVTEPKGEATAPLSWHDLVDKCRRATRFVATPEQQCELLGAISALRDQEDLKQLSDCLTTMKLGQREEQRLDSLVES